MGRKFGQRLGAVLGMALLAGACSGSSKTTPSKAETVCDPGAKLCDDDGVTIKVCNADGSELLTSKVCSLSCTDGACDATSGPGVCTGTSCTETSCLANTKFCQDGSVWKCDPTGVSSKLSQACAKSQFCREQDDSASCTDQACTPGEAMCNGDTATKCGADGSGPAPGGLDCSANKQTCISGGCQDTKCIPGSKVCQNEDVYLCAKNGTDTSLLADCQAGTVCDGEKLACATKVCDIGKIGCDGTRAVKCNAFGSGWDPAATDCATDKKVCVDGSCKEQVCTPSSRFCQDGNVFQCDQNGVSSSLWQTCTPSYYHCTPYPSSNYANCEYNQCQPNQKLCDDNVVRTCNPDGSWPVEGTACADDQYCESGTCKALVCEPGSIFCKSGDVYSCDWIGSRSDLYQECPTDTTCKVTDGNFSCIPLPCSPGEVACLGNKIGTCAADGQSLTGTPTDCTATASICGPDDKCAKTVTETLATNEDAVTEYANYVIGDVVQVNSPRTLTEMQINLVLPSARELRWVVFEETGSYTYTARKDWIVSNQSGNDFFKSGAISYSLKAGKTYFLGVAITGGNSSIAYIDTAPFTLNATFGTVLGRIESGYSSVINASPDPGYLYHMKLTTTP